MKFWKHLSKRGLALFLALTMCLGLVQLTAFAQEAGESPDLVLYKVYQLTCQQAEHVHSAACYGYTADHEAVGEGHVCGKKCYNPTCMTPEHVHTKACYELLGEYPEEMLQAAERVAVYACGQEGHVHDFLCGIPVDAVLPEPEEPAPTEPTEPVTPEESAPTEPTEPVTPEEPAPTEPTEPVTPEEPAPTEPTEPVTPEKPAPTEPTEPVTPEEPAPTEPTEPVTPEKPAPTEPGESESGEQTNPSEGTEITEIPDEDTPQAFGPVYSGDYCTATDAHVHSDACTEVIWVADPEKLVQTTDNVAAEINGVGYETLAEAVQSARAGDIITLTKDVAESLTVSESITIDLGGHKWSANGGTTLTTQADVTLKNGTITSVGGLRGANVIKATGGSLTLDGITVTGHDGTNAALDISASVTALTIKDGEIFNNKSTDSYGVVKIGSKEFTMTGTQITDNEGVQVIRTTSQMVTIADVTASGNTSTASGMTSSGGGVLNYSPYAADPNLTMTNVTAYGNTAKGCGGALLLSTANASGTLTATLDSCKFYGNTAGYQGGAIVVASGTKSLDLEIRDTLIHDNTSNFNTTPSTSNKAVGGGLYVGATKPSYVVTLSGNTHVYNNHTPNEKGGYSADIGLASDYVTAQYQATSWAPTFDKYTGKHATLSIKESVKTVTVDGTKYTLTENAGVKDMQYRTASNGTKAKNWYWPIGYSSTVTLPKIICYGTHSSDNADVYTDLADAVNAAKNDTGVVYVCQSVALTEDNVALLNESGVTFKRCKDHHDGYMFTVSGDITLDGAHIDGNGKDAPSNSAMIYVGGKLTVTGETVIENGWNTDRKSAGGGGIYVTGTLNVTGGTIRGNRAPDRLGGGVYVTGSANITGGVFENNLASEGGAVCVGHSGRIQIDNGSSQPEFKANKAALGGAICFRSYSQGEIYGGNFTGNHADGVGADKHCGGAVYLWSAAIVKMKNVYISENRGCMGGTWYGAALSVCPTGRLSLYEINGAFVGDNLLKNGSEAPDIHFMDGNGNQAYISEWVPCGGKVSYTDASGNVLDPSVYQYTSERFTLYTTHGGDTKSNALDFAKDYGVVMTGNTANDSGSAIGCNGFLTIGTATKAIKVTKEWADSVNHDNDQILVYLTKNGKPLADGTRPDAAVVLNKDNNWTYTWSHLTIDEKTGELDKTSEWGFVEAAFPGYTSKPGPEIPSDEFAGIEADEYYTLALTNTPGGPNNTLVIHKTALGSTDPDESYWFTLTLKNMPADAAYALTVNEELIPIYRNADGNPEIRFSLKHDWIATVEGLPDGFKYELTEDEGSYTTAMYKSVTANEGGAGNIYTAEVVNACFEPTTVEIPIQKTLEGREVQKGDYFRFEILKCDADESPEGGAAEPAYDIICLHMGATEDELESTIVADEKNTVVVMVNGEEREKTIQHVAGDEASFQLNGFTLPGEYHYTVHELPNDQFPGVSIDPIRYHVIVDVQMNEKEELSADITDIWTRTEDDGEWNKEAELDTKASLQFTNIFKTQEVTRYFETQKTLVNGRLQPGQFSFLLEEQGVLPWNEDYDNDSGTRSETAETLFGLDGWEKREASVNLRTSNGDSGLVQFEGITYKLADAGETPDTGVVYAYTLREEIPDGAVQNADGNWVYNNIIYSGDVKHVYVHVFTKAGVVEGEKVQIVNANVYSTSEESASGAENSEVYYISGFTNTVIPPAGSLTVVKTWSGDTEAERPASVTVQLLRNGTAYAAAELNAANGWTHTWDELEDGVEWSAAEVNVPEGYTSSTSVSGDGLVVTITNTRTRTPDDPYTPGGDDDDDDDDDNDRTDDNPPPETVRPDIPVLPELPDPNEPDSPDVVTIIEDDVPTTYVRVQDPENEEEFIYIPEDEVPLQGFETPQTGDSGRTALWAFLSTASLIGAVGFALIERKRKEDKE